MCKAVLSSISFGVICAFSGCASDSSHKAFGPSYSSYKVNIAPIASGNGRVYFYRSDSVVGEMAQVPVMVDQSFSVGYSVPAGFFVCDLAAGDHTVSCTAQGNTKTMNFSIKAGETIYIKTVAKVGWYVSVVPIVQDSVVGQEEIADCKYQAVAVSTASPVNSNTTIQVIRVKK